MPSRKQTRKNRSRRGGAAYSYEPASVSYKGEQGMAQLSLNQGRQFAGMTQSYHGGGVPVGLLGGPYPSALGSVLPSDLHGSARIDSTMKAYAEIADLKDGQDGGRRRRRRNSRKNRKSRNSRKNRKSRNSRKNRKSQRRNRRGGGHIGFASVDMPGMLLKDYSKTGLSPEWDLAKNPNAFAPLASRS